MKTLRPWLRSIVARLKSRPPRRFVFVVTYGRSGSTILMKLINGMPGFDIKGENNGSVQQLIDAVRLSEIGKEWYGGDSADHVDHPWYGINRNFLDDHADQIRRIIARHIIHVDRDKRVGGFKEIRYFQLDDAAFMWHINFLLGFRDARIVFLTRDVCQVKNSAWWKEGDPAEVESLIARMDRLFLEAQRLHSMRSRMFDYRQLTDYNDFSRLAEFLGGKLARQDFDEIIAKRINLSASD